MQDKQRFNNQSAIRQHYLDIRNDISAEQQCVASNLVCDQIIASDSYQKAQHIAAYLAFGKEIDLSPLLTQAQQDNKHVYLPRIVGQDIVFSLYTGHDDLVENRFNILEPKPTTDCIECAQLDVIYLPLVAFDQQGHRIGMGGGYYDRYLNQAKYASQPIRIGVAYTEQEVDDCQPNEWDVSLHAVIQSSPPLKQML